MLLSKYKREPEAWNKHVVPYFESGATSRCSSVLWVRGYIIIANTVHLFRLNPWLLELDSSKKEWDSLAKNALNDSERERALPEADTGVAEYRCADLTKKTSRNFPTLLAHLQKSRESGSILEAFFKQNSAVNSSPLPLNPGPDAEEGEETSKSEETGVAGGGHEPQPSGLILCSPSWWPHPGRKVQWQNQQKFWLFTGLSFLINKLKLILSLKVCMPSQVAQLVKNLPAIQETQVQSLGWEDPWRRKWQPTPVLLPGEFHWQRSRVGYSPWDLRVWPTCD